MPVIVESVMEQVTVKASLTKRQDAVCRKITER